MLRRHALLLLTIGLVCGLVVTPLLVTLLVRVAAPVQAQSLPFTPTPEPPSATSKPTADILPTPWPIGVATETPSRTPLPSSTPLGRTVSPYPAPAGSTATATPTATATATATTTALSTPTDRVVVATATPGRGTATPRPSPTPAAPGTVPDSCEPNDTLVAPCSLPVEVDSKEMNVVDGSPDVYSFLLKPGRTYTISAKAQAGLDLTMRVSLATTPDQVIAQNDDVSVSDLSAQVQITPPSEAVYLVSVTNKTVGSVKGKTYLMSAKAQTTAQPTAGGTSTGTTTPGDVEGIPLATIDPAMPYANIGDVFENNYDVDHATALVWGVPYDLSQICPDANVAVCVNGDHDFFLLPVKADVPFVAATYDLGPGADTLLTLYQPDPAQTVQGPGVYPGWSSVTANDDVAPGFTLRSLLELTPDWSGQALLIVAPSSRENPPALPQVAGPPARYRLMVGSPDLPAVRQMLSSQKDLPPTAVPIPPPTAAPTAAGVAPIVGATAATDAREVIREACATGTASTRKAGVKLYAAAPPSDTDAIAVFDAEAAVKLLGQCYRGWVKVQPADSVTPGWMWAADLAPDEMSSAPAGAALPNAAVGALTPTPLLPLATRAPAPLVTPTPPRDTSTGSASTGSAATATARASSAVPQVTAEAGAVPPEPTAAPALPAAHAVTVEVCTQNVGGSASCDTPLVGVRVELLLAATQQVQVAGSTDSAGRVTLSASVPEGTKLLLRIAALGVLADVPNGTVTIPVRVAGGPQ